MPVDLRSLRIEAEIDAPAFARLVQHALTQSAQIRVRVNGVDDKPKPLRFGRAVINFPVFNSGLVSVWRDSHDDWRELNGLPEGG